MHVQERPTSRWTPLKILGAIVIGALAAWGLVVLLFIWWISQSNFTF